MKRTTDRFDSRRWTGEPDYVEVEALPLIFILGAIAFLLIGMMVS
jgi:hypothetical protein